MSRVLVYRRTRLQNVIVVTKSCTRSRGAGLRKEPKIRGTSCHHSFGRSEEPAVDYLCHADVLRLRDAVSVSVGRVGAINIPRICGTLSLSQETAFAAKTRIAKLFAKLR